jgi:hypothetical protein
MSHHDLLWLKIGAAIATIITFSYTTFETKEHSKELLEHIIRIEDKVDLLLDKR